MLGGERLSLGDKCAADAGAEGRGAQVKICARGGFA